MADKRIIIKDPITDDRLYPAVVSDNIYNPDGTRFDLEGLKTSVSEGKALVSAAVTDKGVQTAADATFKTITDNIRKIPTAKYDIAANFLGDVFTCKWISADIPYKNPAWNASYKKHVVQITFPNKFIGRQLKYFHARLTYSSYGRPYEIGQELFCEFDTDKNLYYYTFTNQSGYEHTKYRPEHANADVPCIISQNTLTIPWAKSLGEPLNESDHKIGIDYIIMYWNN